MIIFPHDYAAIARDPAWRNKLLWPVSYRAARDATLDFVRRLMKAVTQLELEEQRQAYVAALRLFAPWSIAVVEAANALDGFGDTPFSSDLPEVLYLRGRSRSNPGALDINKLIKIGSCRRPLARQIVWTAQWTPILQLPATLANPEVVAFNRNPGLVLTARASQRRIRYDNVERYYAEMLGTSCEERPAIYEPDALRDLLSTTLEGQKIADTIRQRLLDLMAARLLPILQKVSSQMKALRRVRTLPQEIWTGTGGYWPSRIVGLEIIRRGGTVRRFDHGYNDVLNRFIEQAVFVEAMVSTHFVLASEDCARRWRHEPVGELISCGAIPQFESLLPLAGKTMGKRKRSNGIKRSRPKVLYTSGKVRGLWRTLPPPLPAAVYVDWTLRLVEMLKMLPIDLICRPHPEGVFEHKPHPLSTVADVPDKRFEELIDDVDIVITDSPFSRVLCQALRTYKPIVFLDPGHDYFCDAVLSLVKERCKIIELSYDERGLPQVDAEQLKSAILAAKRPNDDIVGRFQQLIPAR